MDDAIDSFISKNQATTMKPKDKQPGVIPEKKVECSLILTQLFSPGLYQVVCLSVQ